MLNKIKAKKHIILMTVTPIIFAGVFLMQIGHSKTPPKINAISPSPGYQGIMVTITGAGFTKQSENVTTMRIGNDKFDSGNYIKIMGQIQDSHAFSPDGTTLQIKLDLNTNHVVQECAKRVVQNKPCEVGIKVVNAYGLESNEFHYLITNQPPQPPLRASYEVIPLNPANPTQNITLQKGKNIELYRYKLTADPKNDANIYVLIGGVNARSLGGIPMDCSNIFTYPGVEITNVTDNVGLWSSTFSGGISQYGACSGFPAYGYFSIAPGEQKTISLTATANPTAPVGLQFRLNDANYISSDNYASQDPGTRDVWVSNSTGVDWLDGGSEWSNYITIAP